MWIFIFKFNHFASTVKKFWIFKSEKRSVMTLKLFTYQLMCSIYLLLYIFLNLRNRFEYCDFIVSES